MIALLQQIAASGKHKFLIIYVLSCLFLFTTTGCASQGSAINIAFSPDGANVAFLWEDLVGELAVDGKIWSRAISLHWCSTKTPAQTSSLAINTLGIEFASYVTIPTDIQWSPKGTYISVLTPNKLVVVKIGTKHAITFQNGDITSVSWLSDTEIAYCTRQNDKQKCRREIYRQKMDNNQPTKVNEFKWQEASDYPWKEHWAPNGQYVVFMEPAVGGQFHLVNVLDGKVQLIGQANAHDEGVAWTPDSRHVFCVSDTVGPDDVYQAILIPTNSGKIIDCTQQFRQIFAKRQRPRFDPLWTADNEYIIGYAQEVGGFLIQPDPWKMIPLGQVLAPKLGINRKLNLPRLFHLPIQGKVGVLPTGNEGNSPVKYAADYSGKDIHPLIKTQDIWTISSSGSMVASVGKDKRVEIQILDK